MDEKIDVNEFLKFVYDFSRAINKHQVVLVYEGEVSHQVTKAFTSLTEANLEIQMEDLTTQKKVFHVMVECLQNLSKHAEPTNTTECTQQKDGYGTFLLSKHTDYYCVTTGNALPIEKVPSMTKMLDEINLLDKEGLKNLYKQRIKDGRLSNKGGAGLGFIDIAKKTGSKLHYQFHTIDDQFSFFTLSIHISRNN